MQKVAEGKKRLLVNVGSNIAKLVITAAIGIWLTPYLIRHLGLSVYGVIPLFNSIVHYFDIFTVGILAAIGRFVAIHYNRGEFSQSNSYFNTALVGLLVSCTFLLPLVIVIAIFLPKVFHIPTGYEAESTWLFILIMFSSFVVTVSSPFSVSTFVRHHFALQNLVKTAGKGVQVIVIILTFVYLSSRLIYFGFSICIMAVFVALCSVVVTRILTPELRVGLKLFKWQAFREMFSMGAWIIINHVGTLLYLNIDLVVINLFLGSEQVGRYAPITQWVVLSSLLGMTMSQVFTPIAYELIAKGHLDILAFQTRRTIKFIGIVMALSVGLICGLSRPMLEWWLGASFAELSLLMWLLVGPGIINTVAKPMFGVMHGMKIVRLPAIATFVGGVMNISLSILLVKYTGLGIYGVALATVFCLLTKNLFLTPVYTAVVLGKRFTFFFKVLALGAALAAGVSLTGLVLSKMADLATLPRLMATGVVISVLYCLVCYLFVLDKEDKRFFKSLIGGALKKGDFDA